MVAVKRLAACFNSSAVYGPFFNRSAKGAAACARAIGIADAAQRLADMVVGDKAKLTIGLWARNLLDEAHVYRRSNANNGTLGAYGNFNPPRTFGVEVTTRF